MPAPPDTRVIFAGERLSVDVWQPASPSVSRFLVTYCTQARDEPFASFCRAHAIPAIFVRARTSDWWHGGGFLDALRAVEAVCGTNAVHTGASMGGYGALYGALVLASDAVCFSPQVVVRHMNGLDDPRWRSEWDGLSPNFDETRLLEQSRTKPIFVFCDRDSEWDDKHLRLLESTHELRDAIRVVEVPFAMHATAQLADASGAMQSLLMSLLRGESIDLDTINETVAHAHRLFPKTFAHFVRRSIEKISDEDVSKLIADFTSSPSDDFEYLYMVAEAAVKLGEYGIALRASWESLRVGPNISYQVAKHARILETCVGPLSAAVFLARYVDSDLFDPLVKKQLARLEQIVAVDG